MEAVADISDNDNQDERTEEAEAVGICRESGTTGSESAQPTPAAAKNHTFEVNMNAAYKDPVKYNAANGKDQVLLRIPRSGTEASYHKNAQSIGWVRHLLLHHAGEDVDLEESGV